MPTTSAVARSPTGRATHTFEDHSSQSSFASQHSGAAELKLSTTDVSRSILPAPVPEDLTPPSSNASPSREHEHGQAKVATQVQGTARLGSAPQSARGSRSPSASGSQSEGTGGTKRTASGQVKISQHAEALAESDKPETRRARASSSLSTASASNVAEVRLLKTNQRNGRLTGSQVSQQLRTRLKYAMVKVQNGWQTRSLDELESIASASPKSHASPFLQGPGRGSPFSPRMAPGSKMNRKWSDSSSSEGSRSEPRLGALTSSSLAGAEPIRVDGQPARALAPPADIVPSARRRPTPNQIGLQPPPSRPYHSRPTSQRTPSQNAAMEADAVETLLFMASPSNSGYHPPSQASQESSLRSTINFSSQTSPLRTQFSQTSVTSPKKVAFTDQPPLGLPATKSEIIDHMINSVPEEDDNELDAALRLADQRRDAKLST